MMVSLVSMEVLDYNIMRFIREYLELAEVVYCRVLIMRNWLCCCSTVN